MCPRDREEAFSAPGGVFIASHLHSSRDSVAEPARLAPRSFAPDRNANPAPPPPIVLSGLSKSEAEALLDLFEGAGYQLCQLSFVHGEGFSVRPMSPT